MKKTAIVIKGKADCGKTSTIKKVVEIINNKNDIALIEKIKEDNSLEKVDIKKALEPYDISLIIHLNIGDNGIKIGIESMGDYHHEDKPLFKSLTEFVKEPKCNIIICPTKTQGPTTEVVKSLCNEYDIVWINKNKENKSRRELDIKKRNEELAEKIYNKYIKCFIESDKSTK